MKGVLGEGGNWGGRWEGDSILSLQGNLFGTVLADESVWTLGKHVYHTASVLASTVLPSSSPEDNKLLRMVLVKSDRNASNCWKSPMEGGQYKCNPWVLDQMEKKLTLERFQREVSLWEAD